MSTRDIDISQNNTLTVVVSEFWIEKITMRIAKKKAATVLRLIIG